MLLSPVCASRRQRGLSIVELLVGVAVGLFIVGGAVKLFVDYLSDSRRVLLETRVNQDLRAAADLLVRDLRRAGYWQEATAGIASAPASNPFRTIALSNADLTVGDLTFSYDKAASASEASGFRVRSGALQLLNGDGGWQAVTDVNSLLIDTAQVVATPRAVDMYQLCPCYLKSHAACTAASFTDPAGANFASAPRLTVRQYAVTLRGYAPGAPAVVRELRETVRVRNDQTDGVCPNPP